MDSKLDLGEVVATADGSLTVKHPDHGEEYHSKQGALFEARELYMNRSGFVAALDRTAAAHSVLDVGLGLGYNALATVFEWSRAENPAPLYLTSLEINPNLPAALASGQAPWTAGWDRAWLNWARGLKETESGIWRTTVSHPKSEVVCEWTIYVGDATSTNFRALGVPNFTFIWQDAFSPKKNANLWTEEWFKALLGAADPTAILVTYSVARVVKDSLQSAGWRIERLEAAGTKRNWLKATRPQKLKPSE